MRHHKGFSKRSGALLSESCTNMLFLRGLCDAYYNFNRDFESTILVGNELAPSIDGPRHYPSPYSRKIAQTLNRNNETVAVFDYKFVRISVAPPKIGAKHSNRKTSKNIRIQLWTQISVAPPFERRKSTSYAATSTGSSSTDREIGKIWRLKTSDLDAGKATSDLAQHVELYAV
ncbi:MAG: hypothetical protein GY820_04560 [Gammaproteobacteria bacterium]|nr:hypothetical protein [Gammaproteobacteria bacterium]